MNINTTLSNQTTINQPVNTQSQAFRAARVNPQAAKDSAVNLMQQVRSSYAEFQPDVLQYVVNSMKQRLSLVKAFQRENGVQILDKSSINSVNGKIKSLQALRDAKLNVNA